MIKYRFVLVNNDGEHVYETIDASNVYFCVKREFGYALGLRQVDSSFNEENYSEIKNIYNFINKNKKGLKLLKIYYINENGENLIYYI